MELKPFSRRRPLGLEVDSATAYVNAGAIANVNVGDVFQVYSRGEELTDPVSGLKLGSHERLVRSIQITESVDRFHTSGGPRQ